LTAMKYAPLISAVAFARQIGVTKQAVGKAIKVGRIPVYDVSGASVAADYAGRKFVRREEALSAFRPSRARIDDDLIAQTFEAAGRAVAQSWPALPTWLEEMAGVYQSGGVPALATWARAKDNEQCNQIADMIASPIDDDAGDGEDHETVDTNGEN